jgi:hypothetical protein
MENNRKDKGANVSLGRIVQVRSRFATLLNATVDTEALTVLENVSL